MNNLTASTLETTTCRFRSCSEPRAMSRNGRLLTLCSAHREHVCMQERIRAQAKRAAKNGTIQPKDKKNEERTLCHYPHQECLQPRSVSLAGTLNKYCKMHQERYREYARKSQANRRQPKEHDQKYEPLAEGEQSWEWSEDDMQMLLECILAEDDDWPLSDDDIQKIFDSLLDGDDREP